MKRKILIVDDETRTLMLMEHTLRDLEFDYEDVEILTASNGADALEIIKDEKPILVYLDIMMPIMDGFDVCNTVKHELKMQGVYIVMLTAKGQRVDEQKSADVGADLYMTKPFDPDRVLDIAKTVLGV
jgi:DNA-binding response OmpR family regulator